MGNAGDALPLLRGKRGQQRARCQKEHAAAIAVFDEIEQHRRERHRAAAASAAAAMTVLLGMKDQIASIEVPSRQIYTAFLA